MPAKRQPKPNEYSLPLIRFAATPYVLAPLVLIGTEIYRKNFDYICPYYDPETDGSYEADDHFAVLLIEGEQVFAEIEGYRVGRMSDTAAKQYIKSFQQLNLPNVIGKCLANIHAQKWKFTVRLDLDVKNLVVAPERVASSQ